MPTKEKPSPILNIDGIKKNIVNIIVGIVITAGTATIIKSYSDQQKMIVELELIKKDVSIIKQSVDNQDTTIKAIDKLTSRLEYIIERK